MSWDKVDNKLKKKRDADFVSCEERYERDYLQRTVEEAFPEHPREHIYTIIDRCCEMVGAPRHRKDFVECLLDQDQFPAAE